MKRRRFVKVVSIASLMPYNGFGYWPESGFNPAPLIKAPSDPNEWKSFLKKLEEWKEQKKQELNYNDQLYDRPDFQWVRCNFNCYFLMLYDLQFYDPETSTYLTEEFIRKTEKEFGKITSLVLWHAYPRIGVDERNQFDFYRDMPGGLAGIKAVTQKFHDHGIKVFINYNPWDTSTRRESKSDVDALVEIIAAIDADGIFLDTMNNLEVPIREKLDAVKPGIVLESELDLPVKDIASHHCSWAQWFEDSEVPGILRNKWFEPRHMQHQIKRWDFDHSGELHTAWMNGSGMMIWENVFGSWRGWNNRDKSVIRSMGLVQQHFSNLLTSDNWQPLVKCSQQGVYANKWEDDRFILFTLVNRKNDPVEGELIETNHNSDYSYFEGISGKKLSPQIENRKAVLKGEILARNISCFIISKGKPENHFSDLLRSISNNYEKQKTGTANPELIFRQINVLKAGMISIDTIPDEMVLIPGVEKEMEISFRVRECSLDQSFGNPSKFGPESIHKEKRATEKVRLSSFAMDKYPVTNRQFREFLEATRYRPKHRHYFLKHWKDDKIPAGLENHPVVNVSLEDARAYARWKGKRLPTVHEWTWAAQGENRGKFPWGDEPAGEYGNFSGSETTAVDAYPKGVSPFGCFDMIGNTWEWTESEYSDGRTRFCYMKGGSLYRPEDSKWYILGGPKSSSWVEKFLLMWPGLDRCSTVGFRSAVDMED